MLIAKKICRLSRFEEMNFETVLQEFCFICFCVCYVYSMAIIYGVFSASNLITPSVVAIVGPQLSMFASGLFYR